MKRIVLCAGVFDPLHVGHLRHFRAAKAHGNWLVVAVTKDAYVNKGPNRPVFPDSERREVVASMYMVDRTILVADSLEALEMENPHVFVKGADYRGKIEPAHEMYCKKHGIEIAFTDERTYSSTALLNYYASKARPDYGIMEVPF